MPGADRLRPLSIAEDAVDDAHRAAQGDVVPQQTRDAERPQRRSARLFALRLGMHGGGHRQPQDDSGVAVSRREFERRPQPRQRDVPAALESEHHETHQPIRHVRRIHPAAILVERAEDAVVELDAAHGRHARPERGGEQRVPEHQREAALVHLGRHEPAFEQLRQAAGVEAAQQRRLHDGLGQRDGLEHVDLLRAAGVGDELGEFSGHVVLVRGHPRGPPVALHRARPIAREREDGERVAVAVGGLVPPMQCLGLDPLHTQQRGEVGLALGSVERADRDQAPVRSVAEPFDFARQVLRRRDDPRAARARETGEMSEDLRVERRVVVDVGSDEDHLAPLGAALELLEDAMRQVDRALFALEHSEVAGEDRRDTARGVRRIGQHQHFDAAESFVQFIGRLNGEEGLPVPLLSDEHGY
jgi:hypothetical protein